MQVEGFKLFASVKYAKRDLSISTFRWCLAHPFIHFQSSLCCSGSQGGWSPSQQLSGRRFGTLWTFCLFITGPTRRHINHPTLHIQTPTHTYWAVRLLRFSIIWFNLVWWGSNIHYLPCFIFHCEHYPLHMSGISCLLSKHVWSYGNTNTTIQVYLSTLHWSSRRYFPIDSQMNRREKVGWRVFLLLNEFLTGFSIKDLNV